jgi:hypothetical protein
MGDTMKRLRNIVCACFLTIVFALFAVAGEIQNPGATPTPTPTPPPIVSSPVTGEIQNPGLTALVLDMIASMLSLL